MTYRSALPSPVSPAPTGLVKHTFRCPMVITTEGPPKTTQTVDVEIPMVASSWFRARAMACAHSGLEPGEVECVGRVDVKPDADDVIAGSDRWRAIEGSWSGYEVEESK